MKQFTEKQNIGAARYVVNFHDGAKRHKDGSEFYDCRIFSNKRAAARFVRSLIAAGYKER